MQFWYSIDFRCGIAVFVFVFVFFLLGDCGFGYPPMSPSLPIPLAGWLLFSNNIPSHDPLRMYIYVTVVTPQNFAQRQRRSTS